MRSDAALRTALLVHFPLRERVEKMINGDTDRLPPNEPLMERAIIGCILQKPEIADECASRFKAGGEVFFDLKNRQAYLKLLAMRQAGEPIDITTALRAIGDLSFLSECENAAASAANFENYADKVSEAFMLRKTMAACVEASASVYDKQESANAIISGIETKLQSIREIRSNDVVVSGGKSAVLLTNHLEERFRLQGRKSGLVTGLSQFDDLTDGLQAGEQTIIGARPSLGKTALATTIIHRVCLIDKNPTLVITLEMSIHALCRRILANHCRFPLGDLRAGRFTDFDMEKFAQFNLLLNRSPIFFMDAISGTDSGRICSAIRRTVKSEGVKLVVIDYLQKIKEVGNFEKKTYAVGQVSGALMAVAKETGCALLTLAQLNRESVKEKTPRLPRISDLADSGQIERDADTIGLLHRDRETNGGRDAVLLVAKQRDGDVGNCEMSFEGKFSVFENRRIEPADIPESYMP